MQAIDLVQKFLRAMEARDLDMAEAMCADDMTIVFPANRRFSSQREMVAAAQGRYRWVKKTFDEIDCFTRDDDAEIVYVMGTLYGENNLGVEFANVRYIDRFVVKQGKIAEQYVWNDLAEQGVLQQRQTSAHE